jgi:hypothetical protein
VVLLISRLLPFYFAMGNPSVDAHSVQLPSYIGADEDIFWPIMSNPRQRTAADTPEPQDKTALDPKTNPASSNAALISSIDRNCVTSSSATNAVNGTESDPGICPPGNPGRGSGACAVHSARIY